MSSTTSSPATFRPPNRPGHFLLGVWPEYRYDPLGIFVKAAREQGDVAQLRFGPYINYLISHPDYIQQVLQTNNRHYRHDPFSTDLLKLVSGLNLVTSDGDYWLRQRRLMQPAFHRQRIAGFGKIMTDTTLKMLKRWEVIAARGQFLNMCEEMMRLTMEIIGKALFNVDLSQQTNVLGQAYKTMANYVEYLLNALFHVPLFIPTPRSRALKRAIADINQFLQNMIDERRQKGNQEHDLMAMLLEARDEETGKGMTDQQVRDELLAMIGAGYELSIFPFGGGPRKCIGNTFALTEMQLILATILQRYQLHLKPGYKVEPDATFILRIKDDLPMMVTPR